MEKQKLLFVCSQNKLRSLTAEKLFDKNPDFAVKSAGTEHNARQKITAGMIGWADMIFVMERKHRDRLKQKFGGEIRDKTVITLNIPDDYKFMQPELIEILEKRLAEYIEFG
ncbi:MAG: protein tyrosine phosphatase [Saprospiraceae bacterium]|nr:protein tyrosine phosphatase [Saprospiraceae bacterium]